MPCSEDPALWSLADDVHAVGIDDDLVFLDVRADRYLALPGGGEVFSKADGTLRTLPTELAADLAAAGLIRPGPAPRRPAAALPAKPTRSLEPVVPRPLRAGDLAEMTAGFSHLLRRYRGRSLRELVAWAARRDGPAAGLGDDGVDLVTRFHAWLPYAPVRSKCLLRAFLLLGLLRRCGHDAQWVFAVRTWPFAAHCWLQVGEVVLDDHPDRLVAFHPILAV